MLIISLVIYILISSIGDDGVDGAEGAGFGLRLHKLQILYKMKKINK